MIGAGSCDRDGIGTGSSSGYDAGAGNCQRAGAAYLDGAGRVARSDGAKVSERRTVNIHRYVAIAGDGNIRIDTGLPAGSSRDRSTKQIQLS